MKVSNFRRKLAATLVACGMLTPAAAHAANLNTNLVVNPGFETVNTSIHPPPSVPDPLPLDNSPLILQWSGVQGFAYSHNYTGSVPDYANGGPLTNGGNYYFTSNATPGNIDAPGEFFQDIDVSGGASGTLIATGTAAFSLRGYFSSFEDDGDFGTVHANFLNGAGASLGTASVSDSDVTQWGEDFRGGFIPVGTQRVRVSLFGTAFSGGPDGYIDNVDFRVVNEVIQPFLEVIIDRDTGGIVLANRTNAPVNLSQYTITSAIEALEPANWRSITDNYDAGSPGPNQVDPTHNWTEATNPTANGDLTEQDPSGAGAALAHGRMINLSNGSAWIRNPVEDLVFQYTSSGSLVSGIVTWIDNGGRPFAEGDLNTDGAINAADWMVLRTNQHRDISANSPAEAYRLGDLTGDKLNNHADFVEFKTLYDAANGAGAFAAMVAAVPEPSSVALIVSAGWLLIAHRARREIEEREEA